MTFQQAFEQLYGECLDVMVERQRKYGRHNIPKFGVFGTVVRLGDKMERLINLARPVEGAGGWRRDLEEIDFRDETIEDTLIDIANYATIARAQLRGWWTVDYCPPLEEE